MSRILLSDDVVVILARSSITGGDWELGSKDWGLGTGDDTTSEFSMGR
jgi:hypothetical protein